MLVTSSRQQQTDSHVHERRPALAFAREHIIHGRSTFPSMSLLDLASAAGHSMTEDGAPRVATVVDAALAAPIELTAHSIKSTPQLQLCVDIMGGSMEILSTAAQRPASKHLSATLASAAVVLLPGSTRELAASSQTALCLLCKALLAATSSCLEGDNRITHVCCQLSNTFS